MKYILYFFLITVSAHAQTYHFDYSLESNRYGPNKKDIWEFGTTLFDSKNNAKMSFYTDYQDSDKLKAIVYDKDRGKSHVYFVTIFNDKTIFKYSHSNTLIENKKEIDNPYFIEIAQLDSLNFKVDLYIYTNEKKTKRKKKVTAVFTLEKSDFDYFEIRSDFTDSPYIKERILSMLPTTSKYYLSKVIEKFAGGSEYTFLNTVESSDITIPVPTQK
ncbi:hypothetical protein [Chryseobacterium sp.]|uniref:hypothetical protein n=1 Tax=Chryseobacterium sp. TaxID=1871047 RepID=UPI0028A2CCDD|nr:hypothetical protein [Chryseobacterium sp.]